MKLGVRIVAGVVLLVSAVVLVLGVVGGVGVWQVKGPATDKLTRTFARIATALDFAETNLTEVKASLARAAERLEGARAEQRRLAQEPQQGQALRRVLAQTVQRTVAPDVSNAHQKLHKVAEAAVVVNSVLEDLGNFPVLDVMGLDLDGLTEMNERLADVGPAAWELSRLFGEPASDAEAEAQLSRVQLSVVALERVVSGYGPKVAEARERTTKLKEQVLGWLPPAVLLFSLFCFWVALSQLSLMAHARRWWRGAGKQPF